jgi:hypothetical protein
MENIKKGIKGLYFIFILLNLCTVFSNTNVRSIKMVEIFLFAIFFVFFVSYKIKKDKLIQIVHRIPKRFIIVFSIILIIIGLLARVGLMFIKYNDPASDYGTFFYNAADFSESNVISAQRYISIFPYLVPYIMVLGYVFKLVGVSYNATIAFNVVLDVLSAIILFIAFKKRTSYIRPLLISAVWMINPINIIWCAFAAPIVIVNFLFILLSTLFEFKEKQKDTWKIFSFELIIGIILGIANSFRPIFIIFLIALILYELLKLLQNIKNIKRVVSIVIGIFILLISYTFISKIEFKYIQNIVGTEVAHSSGWTLYVGANVESNGTWNQSDGEKFIEKYNDISNSAENIQKEFQNEAILRIKTNGKRANINLIKEKFKVLTQNMAGYSVDQFWNIQNRTENEKYKKCVGFWTNIFVFIIILLNLLVIIIQNDDLKMYMYMLLSIGLVISHLLVEVSSRYTIHIIVPFSIIGVLNIYNLLKNNGKDNAKIYDKAECK